MDTKTYLKKRKCLYCRKPIADQEHAARKFCRNKTLSDGTIESCKDDYHSPIRKQRNEPFKNIADFQRDMVNRIEYLIDSAGEKVTLDQIKAAGILLSRPVEFVTTSSGMIQCYYIKFLITQTGNNNFKITKHDYQY